MIETPSAVMQCEEIAKIADFLRIGPGDLSQFTLGKLRENFLPNEFSRMGFHTSVIKLIEHVSSVCSKMNTPLSVCLDLEPRRELLFQLLKSGVRSFSVSSDSVKPTLELLYALTKPSSGRAKGARR